ncbi:uncharacterized protein Tco025E_08153 [Trypanosoma conorhini]|uniref:Uncharacterized protein n=1 Tax=Trypanosoma conorhini TaxID=83891 RepID=A0A422NDK1_9TRYP|nr:uncharacterized protein Tco025E_08153 [Trypanosoma conorhini]RNF03570.1 hypothetical protein Tco025E_08153 [Trypanosoma conorhini]
MAVVGLKVIGCCFCRIQEENFAFPSQAHDNCGLVAEFRLIDHPGKDLRPKCSTFSVVSLNSPTGPLRSHCGERNGERQLRPQLGGCESLIRPQTDVTHVRQLRGDIYVLRSYRLLSAHIACAEPGKISCEKKMPHCGDHAPRCQHRGGGPANGTLQKVLCLKHQ